ncbi:MAG TPA: NAD-binding protein [Phycisphaerae bacterium]|nr:NAD-binding protein [Phycisphaerae bacterium]
MYRLRIDELKFPPPRRRVLYSRFWREWCFLRVLILRFYLRFAILFGVLVAGSFAFQRLEPEKNHTFWKGMHCVWCLIFGQPPEDFPESGYLQALFFLVPVIGLTVIIAWIVDFAVMIGDRKRSERSWCVMMATSVTDHIVLVGLGKLGYRVYRLLHRMGEPLVVIERNAGNQFLDTVRRDGVPLLIGDARREALLGDAGIMKARSLVLAADDDLANLEVALDARKLNPGIRVVMRMFDQNMADKIRDAFNIHIAMSQSALSAPAFATAAAQGMIVNSFVVGNELVVVQRWPVDADGPLNGRTVGETMEQHQLAVIEHIPPTGGSRLFPPPGTRLSTGDEVLIQGTYEALIELKKKAASR